MLINRTGFNAIFQRIRFNSDTPAEERVAELLSKCGPSILLSSSSESLAFFLGKYLFLVLIQPLKQLKLNFNYKYSKLYGFKTKEFPSTFSLH